MSLGKTKGRSGGMSKHRKSGSTSKSPKLRHIMAIEASKNERKSPSPLPNKAVKDLFK